VNLHYHFCRFERKPAINGLNCGASINELLILVKFVASRIRNGMSNATVFTDAESSVTELIVNANIFIDSSAALFESSRLW
jgi:hypothetical protein